MHIYIFIVSMNWKNVFLNEIRIESMLLCFSFSRFHFSVFSVFAVLCFAFSPVFRSSFSKPLPSCWANYESHMVLYSTWINIFFDAEKCLNRHTARKSHLCISFLETARPQFQFPNSCVCERFIYSQDRSTYFSAAE